MILSQAWRESDVEKIDAAYSNFTEQGIAERRAKTN